MRQHRSEPAEHAPRHRTTALLPRSCFDTNIVVSAFLWGGNPRAILDAARRGTIKLFTSAALIAEIEDVLSRTKFAQRIAEVGSSVDEMLGDYLALAQLVRPTEHPAVARDPDDDHVIACARVTHMRGLTVD
jgi:putative PIN family toxin of toxin-antitoxin system